MQCPTYIVSDNYIGPCTVRKIYASGLLGGEGSGVWPLAGCHFLLSAFREKCQICQELFFSFCSTLFPLLNTVKMLRTLLSFFKINHCTNADHSISWIKPSIAKPSLHYNHMGDGKCGIFQNVPCSLSDQLFSDSKLSLRESTSSLTWLISLVRLNKNHFQLI